MKGKGAANRLSLWRRPDYSNRTRLLLTLALVAIFCCVVAARVFTNIQHAGELGDVTGALRGGRILVLQLPETVAPLQQLSVFEDGTAARAELTSDPLRTHTETRLAPTSWQIINDLRAEWCQTPPTFRTLRTDEPFYDLGLRCSDPFNPRRVQIPVDQLPPELAALLTSVPSPS